MNFNMSVSDLPSAYVGLSHQGIWEQRGTFTLFNFVLKFKQKQAITVNSSPIGFKSFSISLGRRSSVH